MAKLYGIGIFWLCVSGLLLVLRDVREVVGEEQGEDKSVKHEEEDPEKAADVEEDYVLVLNKDNFEDAIAEHKYIVVEFYAPWCKHCHHLAPIYAKAARLLHNEGSSIKVAKVDAIEEKELAQQYNIRKFPTLKFFRGGQPFDYKNVPDDAEEIVEWLKRKTGPPAEAVTSQERLTQMRNDFYIVVAGFFKKEDAEVFKDFLQVAEETDEIHFVTVHDPLLFATYNIDKDSVVMFRPFDEERVDLVGEINTRTIAEFIDYNRLPYVVEFNPSQAPTVMDSRVKKHILYFISKADERFNERIETLRVTAKKFRGQVIFIHVDIDDPTYDRILIWFYVKKEHCPTTRLVNLEGSLKYRPDSDDWTTDELSQFIQDVLDNKRKEFFVSEEIPEDWDSKPVKVLVGKNFDAIARDPNKDVFVKFYAPWCGFCKELAPVWEALGEKFKDSPHVVIAEMEATSNEIEGLKITIYPTMKFFPKGSSEIIEFQNINTTLERLVSFVENGGKIPEEIKVNPMEKTEDGSLGNNPEKEMKKEEL